VEFGNASIEHHRASPQLSAMVEAATPLEVLAFDPVCPTAAQTRDKGFGNSFSIFPLQGWPRFEMLALWLGSHF